MHALFCLAKENKKINKKIPKKPPKLKKSCSFHLAGEWWKTAKIKQMDEQESPTSLKMFSKFSLSTNLWADNVQSGGEISLWTRSTRKQHSKKQTGKKYFQLHCLWSRHEIEAAPTQNIMFVPLFHWACNPSGNKQKISVRTDEPAGRESRLLWLDTVMLAGVPVTESCKRGSKTRWLVSHESAEGVWWIWAQQRTHSESVSTFSSSLLFSLLCTVFWVTCALLRLTANYTVRFFYLLFIFSASFLFLLLRQWMVLNGCLLECHVEIVLIFLVCLYL